MAPPLLVFIALSLHACMHGKLQTLAFSKWLEMGNFVQPPDAFKTNGYDLLLVH
jgi:hypothetical protein